MSYETFRVEVTRDETDAAATAAAAGDDGDGGIRIEIVAYIDRVPETDMPTRGMLTRAARGVWNSRLHFTGDFDSLAAALAAVAEKYPGADRIRCYEYTVDDEYQREVAPLVKTGGNWRPAE